MDQLATTMTQYNTTFQVNVEKEMIENELQDLLSKLPSETQEPKSSVQLWKTRLFNYELECHFAGCKTVFRLVVMHLF